MSISGALTLITGLLLHLAAGRFLPSPWLVPDLTLIGVVLVVARLPGKALGSGMLVAAMMIMGTWRHVWIDTVLYLGAGLLVGSAATRWDVTDRSVQLAMVAGLETSFAVVWLIAGNQISPTALLLVIAKVGATAACLPLARALVWRRMRLPQPL